MTNLLKMRKSGQFQLQPTWSYFVNNQEDSIELNSKYEFKLPTLSSANQNKFSAQIIAEIKVEEYYKRNFQIQLQKPDISNFPEVVQSVEFQRNTGNVCGCSSYGNCNQNYQCQCYPGYIGKACTFSNQDESSLSQILARIFSQNWFLTMPEEELLTSIDKLTYSPELLSNTQRIKLLQALEGVNITVNNRQRVLKLLSNLADTYGLSSVVDQLVFLIAKTCFQNLNATITLRSENINIIVSPIQRTQPFKSAYVFISKDQLPSESAYLVQTLFRYKKFKSLQSQSSASLTVGLSVYSQEGTPVQVRDLQKGISINLPLDSSSFNVRQTLEKIYSEPSNIGKKIEQNQQVTPFLCRFWDSERSNLSDLGCTFVSVTYEEVTCYCNHMTDFMSFLETGRDVLVNANHSVFYVLWEMSGEDLKKNIGMYFVVCYWIIYIGLAVLFSIVDHCKLKNQFYKKLFFQIHGRGPFCEHESERKLPTRSETDRSRSRPSQIITNTRPSIFKVKPYRSPVDVLGGPMKTITLTDITTEADSKKAWSKISMKLKEYASAAQQERKCCCCVLGKVTCSELKTNNLPFNLFTTTSSMSPRLIRLTMFSFACMLEFAICAFFFQLESENQDDPPFFWEGLTQNFWVALYTVIISLVPLLFVGFMLSFPRSSQKKFELATSLEELKDQYKKERYRVRCRLYTGIILFVLLSLLLNIYIICFCHIASAIHSRDWLSSTIWSIVIDQLVFEIIPAFIVAFLVLAHLWCKCCKSTLCLAVIIEVYRLYRNLTDP